jgi:hypothetical protein
MKAPTVVDILEAKAAEIFCKLTKSQPVNLLRKESGVRDEGSEGSDFEIITDNEAEFTPCELIFHSQFFRGQLKFEDLYERSKATRANKEVLEWFSQFFRELLKRNAPSKAAQEDKSDLIKLEITDAKDRLNLLAILSFHPTRPVVVRDSRSHCSIAVS